jgi:hypothetical protein
MEMTFRVSWRQSDCFVGGSEGEQRRDEMDLLLTEDTGGRGWLVATLISSPAKRPVVVRSGRHQAGGRRGGCTCKWSEVGEGGEEKVRVGKIEESLVDNTFF